MNDEAFKNLVTMYLEDEIDADGLERLNHELSQSDERVRQFNDMRLLLGLIHEHGRIDTQAGRDSLETVASGHENLAKQTGPFFLNTILPWSIAALFACLLFHGKFFTDDIQVPVAEDQNSLAILVDETGASFESGFAPDGVHFDAREYRLASGAIHIRLKSGADLMMHAPTNFRLRDLFRLDLFRGSLRAIAPPAAEGLTVNAPNVRYEDLGTEFGVTVDGVTGHSKVHVFDGQVDARDAISNRLISSLTSGRTMEFSGKQFKQVAGPAQHEFLSPGDIGLIRWQQWRQQLLADPSLVAYYDFVPEQDQHVETGDIVSRKLINRVERDKTASEGRIKGARWVSGRWPGKSALLFDRNKDSVNLHLHGNHDALTFAAWIKLDRLSTGLTTLLSSNGFKEGDIHWDIANDCTMSLTKRFSKEREQLSSPLYVPYGKWVHVAGTISEEKRCVYLNGQLAGMKKGQQGPYRLGMCRIGHWLRAEGEKSRRHFRGRMDELAIWKRVLSEAEIKVMVEAGKPDALWSRKWQTGSVQSYLQTASSQNGGSDLTYQRMNNRAEDMAFVASHQRS